MKTIEIEIAVMRYLDISRNIIVPNVSWGIAGLHECDLLALTKSNYATEIEIKVDKYDLLKDKEKRHGHRHNHIKYLFFAVPENLEQLALDEIPERSGLMVVRQRKIDIGGKKPITRTFVEVVRDPVRNKAAVKWSNQERHHLARLGCMRLLGLKEKILSNS